MNPSKRPRSQIEATAAAVEHAEGAVEGALMDGAQLDPAGPQDQAAPAVNGHTTFLQANGSVEDIHSLDIPPGSMNGNGTSAAAVVDPPNGMTSDRQVSHEDIQTVQNLVERCLQRYMTQAEVVDILKSEASVDPTFTTLIWQKLEEQNSDFFRCYYTRLKLKGQILMFNHLLEQQVQMVQKMKSTGGFTHGMFSQPTASVTAGGLPLFQGSTGGKGIHPHVSDQEGARLGGSVDFAGFGMVPPLDTGPSPLLSGLAHINSESDLLNIVSGQTPGEAALLSQGPAVRATPENPLMTRGNPGGLATLPRNFSLSDLNV